MNIAILDDEPAQAQLLARHVQSWARQQQVAAAVTQYHTAAALLFAQEGEPSDALLLDIQMPGMDGMALARRIREQDSHVAIIFVTGYADYIAEGYDVAALHYLMKPVNEERLFAVLDRALCGAQARPLLLLQGPDGARRMLPEDILWVEAFAHGCRVTAAGGAFDVHHSIGDLEQRLSKAGFDRPHRSYLVNLRRVRRVGRDELELDNGATVPMSRQRFDAVQRAFLRTYREEP